MSVTEQRLINGVELPPAGTYAFDPEHTFVEFIGTHIFTKTRGRFTKAEGTIVIGERPEDSTVDVRIEATSLRSNSDMRDDHLRSPDFLNVDRFPEIRFVSTGIRIGEGNAFELDGELTIKDITRHVTLHGAFHGATMNPFGSVAAGFSASTTFEREDFDMTWNMALEAGGVLVGKTVRVEIEVEAHKQD